MDGHQLHRVLAGLGLVVAGFERGVREESAQRREGFAGVEIDDAGGSGGQRGAVLVQRQRHRIAAKAFLGDKALGGIDEFF